MEEKKNPIERVDSFTTITRPQYWPFERDSKHWDTGYQNWACYSNPQGINLSAVNQGTDNSQRIGKKILLLSMEACGTLKLTNSGLIDYTGFAIVYDRFPRASAPTYSEVFEWPLPETVPLNEATERFQILYIHRSSMFRTSATVMDSVAQVDISFKIDLEHRLTTYKSGTSGFYSNHASGALLMFPFSRTASPSANAPLLTATFQIRYLDDI